MSLIQDLAAIALYVTLLGPPIAASAREVKRGGNGLRSAMIVGAVVWPGFGFVSLLMEFFRDPRIGWVRDNLDWFAIVFPMSAVVGAVIGLLGGIAYHLIRILTRLPKTLRLRAERRQRQISAGRSPLTLALGTRQSGVTSLRRVERVNHYRDFPGGGMMSPGYQSMTVNRGYTHFVKTQPCYPQSSA